MKPRISMISLAVSDIEAATKFYRDGLQLPMLDSLPGLAFFDLNGTWLGLSIRENLAKDSGVDPKGSGYQGFNLAHNVCSEEEVKALFEEALAAGATAVKQPQLASWGGFHAYFKDLDDHLWEIAFNPFAWVGPRDE